MKFKILAALLALSALCLLPVTAKATGYGVVGLSRTVTVQPVDPCDPVVDTVQLPAFGYGYSAVRTRTFFETPVFHAVRFGGFVPAAGVQVNVFNGRFHRFHR